MSETLRVQIFNNDTGEVLEFPKLTSHARYIMPASAIRRNAIRRAYRLGFLNRKTNYTVYLFWKL